ncbi:MAG: response regulator [Rhodocyclaceae bacterium]|nr:response regulator [Rhodocyclaceae bacterium]
MSQTLPPTILAVDDTPDNLHLLAELLQPEFRIKVANSGERALQIVAASPPDLILLDIMMPGMSGYEVCAALKANPASCDIPIIFVTAMSEIESEAAGLELGAVDYLTKPISPSILLARVRNHLRMRQQALQLQEWNRTLEQRVSDGITEIERLGRLRRFFSPAVADLLLAGKADDPLRNHRREIVVVFLDLRGYTAFTEAYGADEVMRVLAEFHAAMGELIMAHGGTLERFAGDGLMIFFNDPIEIPDPVGTALSMTQAMHQRFAALQELWQARGYTLAMGIGMAQGMATIGAIGFEGRRDYGAIGSVTNLSARLCGEAKGGQTLVSAEAARNAPAACLRAVTPLPLKGFKEPVTAYEVI